MKIYIVRIIYKHNRIVMVQSEKKIKHKVYLTTFLISKIYFPFRTINWFEPFCSIWMFEWMRLPGIYRLLNNKANNGHNNDSTDEIIKRNWQEAKRPMMFPSRHHMFLCFFHIRFMNALYIFIKDTL